jgi:hypothetical protein
MSILTSTGLNSGELSLRRRLFNGFLAILGLGLGILGFYGQMSIKATCGSTPLRNSILGLILLGISLSFVAGTMFLTDQSMMNTKVFVLMLFLIGATTLGLAGVIMKNSGIKCESDFLCKKTIGGQKGQSQAGSEPCKNIKVVADIALAIGVLLVIAALMYVYAFVDRDKKIKSGSTNSPSSGILAESRGLRANTMFPRKKCSS